MVAAWENRINYEGKKWEVKGSNEPKEGQTGCCSRSKKLPLNKNLD